MPAGGSAGYRVNINAKGVRPDVGGRLRLPLLQHAALYAALDAAVFGAELSA